MKVKSHIDPVCIQTILTRSLVDQLNAMAGERSLNRSILIRQACTEFLSRQTEVKSLDRQQSTRA